MKKHEFTDKTIVVGCNYHTTWQSHPNMRFVLESVNGDMAILKTRRTKRRFQTSLNSLIFINTYTNRQKAIQILKNAE